MEDLNTVKIYRNQDSALDRSGEQAVQNLLEPI
jgi:hypothetical protein